ncbi:MAG: adenosylhomocysteinase [Candidatus Marinimicrobia bacterium]|nr:adenosylhomocysteinase [Candidatus Neomarinimicrobiota bacterium]MDP6456157.1 adenosylhomocysteinase [Candidatus Neomarinimicrobiota bacterium]MDP6593691.1 adenosylhomocysteinase [Candidatus Neomarinimicrobiota bacterium]MDP6836368.1 adenosylhomocysteinase [Candidatus Neomarinimicrobiota bacterium]MDP6965760.1 adenosylhomocysteinase [Candidatus Neomarinimicrobiota bacterium]
MTDHHIKEIELAAEGKRLILWADRDMPVLTSIRERFNDEQPLKGIRLSACLHITAETANLARTLQAGGAEVVLCASNPLSTQDEVAASLVKDFGVSTYAINGENNDIYYDHIRAALDHKPHITLDDGADLVSMLHSDYQDEVSNVKCSMEETTTGVIRLRAMEKSGALKIPVVAVNDADSKHLFDNRYGTGQSTVEGIVRATGVLLAGKTFVVGGYGMCGRGLASRARGMGAHVIVTEVDPLRGLEAAMDGYTVMRMLQAAAIGDIFCTVTGNTTVLDVSHFEKMKDGTVVANSGHFNVEIDIDALEMLASEVKKDVKEFVDEYVMADGRRIYLLGEGRLINLVAAEGHPASVMDMSFSVQALMAEYTVRNDLPVSVHAVPREIDELVAGLKLKAMGIKIDALSNEQKEYLDSWESGT